MFPKKLVPASQTGLIQAMPLKKGLVNLTSADPAVPNVNLIDCIEMGEVTVVWDDGTSDDIPFLEGMQKAIMDIKTVKVKSGKFHFA